MDASSWRPLGAYNTACASGVSTSRARAEDGVTMLVCVLHTYICMVHMHGCMQTCTAHMALCLPFAQLPRLA